jgi:fatty acid desaturase
MSIAGPSVEGNTPELQRRVNALRRTDNWTNWFYLGREYLFLLCVATVAIGFYQCRAHWGIPWPWLIPVTALAVLLIGIGQHRLLMLGHEASHYLLFRNRLLNELASDWLCMFPILSVTHNYRLQHLAHHQFVNDPKRDPDLQFMEASGQRCRLPLPGGRFIWECILRPLCWLPGLARYLITRARHTSIGGGPGPYKVQGKRSLLLVRVGGLYLLSLVAASQLLPWLAVRWLLALVPLGLWLAAMTFFGLAPERLYPHTAVKPVISPRGWTIMRLTYLTVLFATLGWLTYLTDTNWGLYYLVLWVVPLWTVFAFFMVLREGLQHGGTDCGRFTSSRVFLTHGLVRFAVLPLGMAYHLPHHLYQFVPHYRLHQLHALLMETDAYRQQAHVLSIRRKRSPTSIVA